MFQDIDKKQKKEYIRKGITQDAHLRRLFPNKYKDYTHPYLLKDAHIPKEGRDIAVLASIREVSKKKSSNGIPMLVVKATDRDGTPFTARFMGMVRLHSLFKAYIGSEIIMMGQFQYDPIYGFSVFSPDFSHKIAENIRVKPVYGTIKNIPAAAHMRNIDSAVSEKEVDTLPPALRGKYPEINEAFHMMHSPDSLEAAASGQARILLDDILYFKLRLIYEQAGTMSRFRLSRRSYMDEQISRFPYQLTKDQMDTVNGILELAEGGKRIRALVQGDVGSGKTAVAFCLMFCAAENGFQSVLMAPTQVLARQHYLELCRYTGPEEAVLLDGTSKGRGRASLEKSISEGKVKYIVGTSAVLSAVIDREKIGLAVIDEEHRFGVVQRTGLYNDQTHVVTMSATPIPRTLAQSVYGKNTAIFQIRQKPAGRLPVKTYYDNGEKAVKFLYAQVKAGGQAYVICAAKEDCGQGAMEGVRNVEEVYGEYRRLFEPLGFPVGMVTSSVKQKQKETVLKDFSDGKIRILISTTVVEVGVNVPEATVIMILNAERFGLATLHQLRGRVGRSSRQSYCVLVSNECGQRIRTMCMTNDGFAIAERDLKERRSGDLLGLKQSGKNKFVEEILDYPEIAQDADLAARHIDFQSGINHIGKYRMIYGDQ